MQGFDISSSCSLGIRPKFTLRRRGFLLAEGLGCCRRLELPLEGELVLPWGIVRIGLRNASEAVTRMLHDWYLLRGKPSAAPFTRTTRIVFFRNFFVRARINVLRASLVLCRPAFFCLSKYPGE